MENQVKTSKWEKSIAPKKRNKKCTSLKTIESVADVVSQIDSFTITMKRLREMAKKEANLIQFSFKDLEKNLIDPDYTLELTKNIHGTGEKNISEYVKRNTEILLNEHASVIRKQVIEDMKKQMQEMSEQHTLNSLKLESNISSFFELIESSYLSASESFHRVISLAKENFEKEELIRQKKNELDILERDVQQLEEQLLECLMCYAFVQSLDPSAKEKSQIQLPEDFLESFGPSFSKDESFLIQKKALENLTREDIECIQEPDLSASEIIEIIERLKNSNLTLVHNRLLSKETAKIEGKESSVAQKNEEEMYDENISSVEKELQEANEINKKLTQQLMDLKKGKLNEDVALEKEKEIKKLTELYHVCSGSDAKNVDIFLMKYSINYCLDDIFHKFNKYPKKKIKEMLKTLETEKKIAEKKAEEALRAERLEKRLRKTKTSVSRK